MAKSKTRFLTWIAGTWLMLAVLPACDQEPEVPVREPRESSHKAVFVGDYVKSPTFDVLRHAADWFSRRIKDMHVEVIAPQQASSALQQELIESLPKNIDMLFIVPIDAESLKKIISDRAQAGAAVFLIGLDVPGSNRIAHSGPSEMEMGAAAARSCVTLLEGKNSSLLLLHAGIDRPLYGTRLMGFKEEIGSRPAVHILREIDCHDNWIEAMRKVRQETRLYPRAGAWVFLADWPLQGLRTDEALFPAGGPPVILCNGGPTYLDYLRRGQIQALITFDFHKAVHEALYSAIAWADSQQRMPVTDKTIPCEIITIKELETFQKRWDQWQKGGA